MDTALLHYYRQARAHYAVTNYRGVVDGQAAIAAYWSARRTLAFRADLAQTVAAGRKRSKAAKRGWKTRRAAA